MIPRKELKYLLQDRLKPYLPPDKIEQLVGDLMNLEAGWEEVDVEHRDMGYSVSVDCSNICWLADQVDHGVEFKLFRKKRSQPS